MRTRSKLGSLSTPALTCSVYKPSAIPLMRVWLRENIRYVLTLAGHGQPVDDRYLAMQLRAFNDLRLWRA